MDIVQAIKGIFKLTFILMLVLIGTVGHCEDKRCILELDSGHPSLYQTAINLKNDVLCDFSIYFGKDNLQDLGIMFAAIATMANTNIDYSISHRWKKSIHSPFSHDFFKVPDGLGKFNYVATYLGTMALGHWQCDTEVGHTLYTWGYRSLRTIFLVGVQDPFYGWLIGNGRPYDGRKTSRWKPFKKGGEAGCSGHSFNGAVPFMTAAMMTDSVPLKLGFYGIALLPGLARINKQSHYTSQVLLSWTIAYLAARSVDCSEEARDCCALRTCVIPTKDGGCIQASLCF
jgi:hypothetical protein